MCLRKSANLILRGLSLAESLLLMADREILAREDRRLQRLLKAAKLRYPQACVQEIDYKQSRNFNQQQLRALTHCEWVTKAHNVIFVGPTGVGKSYFACALGHQACPTYDDSEIFSSSSARRNVTAFSCRWQLSKKS